MNKSIWQKTACPAARKPLRGDLETEVAVIGGGLAGVLTAYELRQAGIRAVVLERGRTGGGQTQHTTAKITAQHGLIYHRLTAQLGEEKARQYAHANLEALDRYRRIIREEGIDCDFADAPSYLYTTSDPQPLVEEREAAEKFGLKMTLTRETELPFPAFALRLDGQAQFHPLKFLYALAASLEIYEDTPVTSIDGTVLTTPGGRVKAGKVVFACHFPFVNFPGYYFIRMHQERSYLLALENAGALRGMYLGVDPDGLSFRSYGDLLLLGGGSHRTGENSAGGQYERLRQKAREYWPKSREAAAWSAQDCRSLDGIPYIGPFSGAAPGWYVATGFEKWGMTSSMAAAKILCDCIVQRDNCNSAVFSPQRFTPSASAQMLMEETAHAVKGLTRKLLAPPRAELDALPAGHGGVVEWNGEKVGVYKDEKGEVFPVDIRCPHLGCQLEWNPDEKSWDCPCHGSRFDYEGRLLDGPAQEGLNHV